MGGWRQAIEVASKAWLVSLACDKAKEHGYPHELWTTRLLARHAASTDHCLARLVQGTVCKLLGQEEIKPQKVRYLSWRRRVRAEDGGGSVCLSRGPDPEKGSQPVEEVGQTGSDRLLR